jgi:hypothetical protein
MASKRKINEVTPETEKVGKLREIGWRLHTQGLEYIINEEKIEKVKPASRITNLKEYLLKYLTTEMKED